MRWRAGAVVRSIPAAALLLAAGLALAAAQPARAQPATATGEPVDVALVLAIDVSRSMSREELAIQRRGYAEAIASREVLRAISQGPHGRIGIAIFEWAGDFHGREVVSWTIIESEADAQGVAARLLEQESIAERRTSISGALMRGMAMLQAVPYSAERLVIDVSGDGPNNQGPPVTELRDAAVSRGITINGLPMMTTDGFAHIFGIPDLDEYYRRCVIGGPGAFVVPVNGWDQFPEAVRRKLVLEIGGLAPPDDPLRDPWLDLWQHPLQDARPPVVPAQFAAPAPYDCLIGEKIWQNRRNLFDDGYR
ncbi:DUF1194 domain-containing protein [Stappia sp. 28M-7]|uniref:DUF1194 domain-containing protein n=1 Tax=Stappia sp. 28M-7 TaxID=2762596 RepID=UPI00163CD768|nr:DUF1194 domain-containing protein [Stappia sp. 28M-7]MBC2858969.1 DUF1194 domain-containing protein [Stappia sp. 28M-7]